MSEQEYFGICLDIQATGVLTFRRMPSAILHISSYPFIPPTTLSGWLRRLWMLSEGILPETDVKKPNFYAMPQDYHVLGGYPLLQGMAMEQSTNRAKASMHIAKRHGVRAFNHDAFSRLSGGRTKNEVYQLHTWEYLTADRFRGIVLHHSSERLEELATLVNYGCKCGKEGYAFLTAVSPVTRYSLKMCTASSSVPATGDEILGQPADMFVAYRYEHNDISQSFHPATPEPSAIKGYVLTWLGWPQETSEMAYLTNGTEFVPAGMVEVF